MYGAGAFGARATWRWWCQRWRALAEAGCECKLTARFMCVGMPSVQSRAFVNVNLLICERSYIVDVIPAHHTQSPGHTHFQSERHGVEFAQLKIRLARFVVRKRIKAKRVTKSAFNADHIRSSIPFESENDDDDDDVDDGGGGVGAVLRNVCAHCETVLQSETNNVHGRRPLCML